MGARDHGGLGAFQRQSPPPSEREHWRPSFMGVLNVTPDSFSDGGKYASLEAAVARGVELVAQGADVLDVGGESTRPGADPVTVAEEMARVVPVIEALRRVTRAPLSIDTMKAQVAVAAVRAGAVIVNDVSGGLHDPKMLPAVAGLRRGSEGTGPKDVHLVLMHRQGDPKVMQVNPEYGDVIQEVSQALAARARAATAQGIPPNRITLDPGIGFGKRLPHNLSLLGQLAGLRELGFPLLIGASRKSFIGHVTGAERPGDWLRAERRDEPSGRIGGTAAAVSMAALQGAEVLRVHDVAVCQEAVAVALAIQRHGAGPPVGVHGPDCS